MYPHRNRIFLRLNNKLKDNGWELAALDGVDDFYQQKKGIFY